MEFSIYMEKSKLPAESDLVVDLGTTYNLWQSIKEFVLEKYPKAIEDWNFPGKKYGWGFRLKDKKRAIIYLGPRKGFFQVAFVFGQKATDAILESTISDTIKVELQNAKVYAEGRGIRFEVKDGTQLEDIFRLVEFKLRF